MEELLKQFMYQMNHRFDKLEKRFDNLEIRIDKLEKRFDNLEIRIDKLEKRFDNLEIRIDKLEVRFNGLETRFNSLENEVGSLKFEQTEMRKEISFYYGSLMQEHKNTRSEMRSSFKQTDDSIKQHQNVIELLTIRTNPQ